MIRYIRTTNKIKIMGKSLFDLLNPEAKDIVMTVFEEALGNVLELPPRRPGDKGNPLVSTVQKIHPGSSYMGNPQEGRPHFITLYDGDATLHNNGIIHNLNSNDWPIVKFEIGSLYEITTTGGTKLNVDHY